MNRVYRIQNSIWDLDNPIVSKLRNFMIRATVSRYLLHAFYSYFMILNEKKSLNEWFVCQSHITSCLSLCAFFCSVHLTAFRIVQLISFCTYLKLSFLILLHLYLKLFIIAGEKCLFRITVQSSIAVNLVLVKSA